jgi:radical SAM superfamily enzyme YgiQ (UPF0313 family)
METTCLILTPPLFQSGNFLMPRGALSIASYLNHHGVSTALFPLNALPSPAFSPGFNDMNYIAGLLEPVIQSTKPRVIGLSCPFSYLYPLSMIILKTAKSIAPGALTVVGGPHVTYNDGACLRDNPWVDVVVRGEGEWTMAALCRAVSRSESLEKVEGISLRSNGGPPGRAAPLRTPSRPLGKLEDLPALDFSLLPADYTKKMLAYGILSRGCAYKCAFCQESRFWQGRVRHYPVSRFMRELSELYYKYDNRMASIDDSMLSMKSRTWFDLAASLKAEGIPLHEEFSVVTRADTVTPEGLDDMADIGIKTIVIGVETASPKVAALMNKGLDLSRVVRAAGQARERGIRVSTFWIIGHPGDDPSEAETSFNFLCSLYRRDLTTSSDPAMFVPYPGTVFYSHPEQYGLEILNHDFEQWIRGNQPVVRLKHFAAGDILRWYRRFFKLSSYRTKLSSKIMKRADGLSIVPAGIEGLPTEEKALAWRETINALYPDRRVTLYWRKNHVALDISPDLAPDRDRTAHCMDLLEKAGLAVLPGETGDFGLPWFRSGKLQGDMMVRFACHGLLRVIPPLEASSE